MAEIIKSCSPTNLLIDGIRHLVPGASEREVHAEVLKFATIPNKVNTASLE